MVIRVKVKVSSKGQISIPARYRKRLKVEPGDEISIVESGDNLIIYPYKAPTNDELKDLFNRLNGIWRELNINGAEYVRSIRKGGTRDAWQ